MVAFHKYLFQEQMIYMWLQIKTSWNLICFLPEGDQSGFQRQWIATVLNPLTSFRLDRKF